MYSGSEWVSITSSHTRLLDTAVQVVIGDGENVVVDTDYLDIVMPYSMSITGWTILADAAGDIVVSLLSSTTAAFPGSLTAFSTGNDPTLSTEQINTATGLSWSLTKGDIVRFDVTSAATVTQVSLALTGVFA